MKAAAVVPAARTRILTPRLTRVRPTADAVQISDTAGFSASLAAAGAAGWQQPAQRSVISV